MIATNCNECSGFAITDTIHEGKETTLQCMDCGSVETLPENKAAKAMARYHLKHADEHLSEMREGLRNHTDVPFSFHRLIEEVWDENLSSLYQEMEEITQEGYDDYQYDYVEHAFATRYQDRDYDEWDIDPFEDPWTVIVRERTHF